MRALVSLAGIVLFSGAGVAGFNVVGMQCMLMAEPVELPGAAISLMGSCDFKSQDADAEALASDKAGRASVNFQAFARLTVSLR